MLLISEECCLPSDTLSGMCRSVVRWHVKCVTGLHFFYSDSIIVILMPCTENVCRLLEVIYILSSEIGVTDWIHNGYKNYCNLALKVCNKMTGS
jgi:hypothetical protein